MSTLIPFPDANPSNDSNLYLLTDEKRTCVGLYDSLPIARAAAEYEKLQHWIIWLDGNVVLTDQLRQPTSQNIPVRMDGIAA